MITMPSYMLIILSSFTMNLSLQCALGIKGMAESRNYGRLSILIKLGIVLISIILLWILFSKILSFLFTGIFVYVFIFPVSFIFYEGLEYAVFKILLKKDPKEECFISFPEGILAFSLFICLNTAVNFFEVLLLSLGFILGILLVCIIIREIRRRAALEAVPEFLKGKPLVLITLGLLSLIFSLCSIIILRMVSAGL